VAPFPFFALNFSAYLITAAYNEVEAFTAARFVALTHRYHCALVLLRTQDLVLHLSPVILRLALSLVIGEVYVSFNSKAIVHCRN